MPAVVRGVHTRSGMFKIVRCPDSTQLELVECLETPLGSLIHRCTRFRPACALKCTRACASELDKATHEERCGGPIRERDGHLELECELDEDTL